MKEHFSSRVTKLLVILALAIVASVMFVIVGCDGGEKEPTHTVHSWVADSSKTNIAPTCTTDGVDYFICSECGMTSTEPVPATGHTWDSDGTKGKPATCTEDGWFFYRECTECGYVDASDRMAATGHTLDFADVTINAPFCTTDGSITGKCVDCGESITLQADEIDTSANGNLVNYSWTAAKTKEKAANAAAEKGEKFDYNLGEKEEDAKFLQALDHEYFYDNVYSCVAKFTDDDKTIFGDNAAENPSKYYYDYCTRCKTAFEVKAHTAPDDAVPCKDAADKVPAGYTAPDKGRENEYAAAGSNYSYKCVKCQNYIAKIDHSMQVMEKVGENEYGEDIFEPAPEGTVLDCRYYSVCEWCGKVEVAKAHTYPTAGDTAHLRNCAHGDICTVCGDELNTALPHNFDGKDGVFDNHTGNTTATCTENGYTYTYCTMCKARDEAGEAVEWVEEVNYTEDVVYAHHGTWVLEYAPTSPLTSDTTVFNCVTGYKIRQVCKDCGEPRVESRPTVYSDKEMKKVVKNSDLTKTTATVANPFDQHVADSYTYYELTAGKTYYIAGANGKAQAVNSTNFSMRYVVEAGKISNREWTDNDGYYLATQVAPKDHALAEVDTKEYTTAQYKEYVAPNCISGGNVLYKCSVCGTEIWQPKMDKDGNEIFDPTNHASKEQAPCAAHDKYMVGKTEYSYCVECDKGNHPLQYSITLKFTVANGVTGVTAPADVVYNVYGCWPEQYITEIDKDQIIEDLKLDEDKNFEFDFTNVKITLAETGEEIKWKDIGAPGANNTRFDDDVVISNVVATPKEAYTINFVSGSQLVTDGLLENAYQSDDAFAADRDDLGNQVVFADRAVYAITTDKTQRAPELSGYNLFFYTKEDGKAVTFSFSTYDFNDVEKDMTIYVVARARVNG